MGFILFLLSAAFLGWLFYWGAYKKTTPSYIDRFFYTQKDYNDNVDRDKPSIMAGFTFLFIVLLFVASSGALYPFFSIAIENRAFGWLFYPWVGLIVSGFIMGMRIAGAKRFSETVGNDQFHREWEEIKSAHNSTEWATEPEARACFPETGKSGVSAAGHQYFRFQKKGHILTVGSARAGKGTSLLVPALLDKNLNHHAAPSWVVLDPRGENLAIVGRSLQEKGYRLIVLNPYNIREIAHFGKFRFNPFGLFDADSPDFNKYVDLIMHSISPPETERHSNSYFSEAARDMVSLYIRYMMCQDEEPKTITTVYRWLRLSKVDRNALFDKMADEDRYEINGDMQALSNQIVDGGNSTKDVYANAVNMLSQFRDQQIRDAMEESDFSLEEISKEKTALFICLGPEDMMRVPAWMRIITSSVMRGLMRHYNVDRKVVMMLDEFYSMGSISEFANVQYLAMYNVTVWVVVQDLNQLQHLYPKVWEGFIANSVIHHWIAIGDNFTADYLSKRLGTTIVFMGYNPDKTIKYREKPLLTMAEVQQFPNIIMEIDGLGKPYNFTKGPYWEWQTGFDPNPFYPH